MENKYPDRQNEEQVIERGPENVQTKNKKLKSVLLITIVAVIMTGGCLCMMGCSSAANGCEGTWKAVTGKVAGNNVSDIDQYVGGKVIIKVKDNGKVSIRLGSYKVNGKWKETDNGIKATINEYGFEMIAKDDEAAARYMGITFGLTKEKGK